MKIKQLFTATLLLIICSGSFLISCRKSDECKSCKVSPPDFTKSLTVTIGNHTQPLSNVQVWRKSYNTPFEFADERLTDEAYNGIDGGIKLLTGSTQDAVLTVLYLNRELSQISDITPALIKGISRFCPDANMLQHEFYSQAGNQFIKDRYLSVHSNAISMGAIYEINNSIAKSDKSSIIIIDRRKGVDYKIKNNVDILRKIAVKYSAIKDYFESNVRNQEQPANEAEIFLYASKIMPDAGRCGGDCTIQNNSFCARELGTMYPATYRCYKESNSPSGGGGGACRTQNNRTQILEANAMRPDSVYAAHNDSLHYSIRDLFNRSEFGKKYISYYYYFSEVYQNNVTLIIALKTAGVLFSFNDQLQKLLRPSEYANEVFLSSEMKGLIIALINDYKRIYNDSYNNVFLNDIINDLNANEGKPVSQIAVLF